MTTAELRAQEEFYHRLLVADLQTGLDQHAANVAYEMLLHDLEPLSLFICARFHDLDLDERISATHEALVESVQRFDQQRGKFYSYFGTILGNILVARRRYWGNDGNRTLRDAQSIFQGSVHESDNGGRRNVNDLIPDPHDYHQQTTDRDELRHRWRGFSKHLTPTELAVAMRSYDGDQTYQDIADEIGVTSKAIDNARQRTERKRAQYLEWERLKDRTCQRSNSTRCHQQSAPIQPPQQTLPTSQS
jgi:RNA polymerase sigma factor (sigma-70 family)